MTDALAPACLLALALASCGGQTSSATNGASAGASGSAGAPAGTGGASGTAGGPVAAGGTTSTCTLGPGVTTFYTYDPAAPPSSIGLLTGPALALAVDDSRVYFGGSAVFHVATAGEMPHAFVPTAGVESVSAIAVSEATLFATAYLQTGTAGIFHAPLDGTSPGSVLPMTDGPLGAIVVDGSRVFVATGTGIRATDVDFSNPTTYPVSGQTRALAASGGSVFATTGSFTTPISYSLLRGASSGGVTTITTSAHEIDAVAATPTHVYWAELSDFHQPDVPTIVRRAAHDGSGVETFATLDTGHLVFALAVDEHALYYSDGARIVQVDPATKATTVLADQQLSADHLIAHGGAVYWLNQPQWKLSETPKENGVRATCTK